MELSGTGEKVLEKAKDYYVAPLILVIFGLAFGLRYYPVRNIQYLQALDPYNLFRMSQQIAYTGSLPDLDFMRYFPYAAPTYYLHQMNLWIPAILYWAGGFLVFDSYLDFAYTTMPLFSGLAAVTIYFLGKELYDKYTGLGAAFFIAVIPGAMFRSSAGFFEKEATGTFLMIVSMLFFILAWKKASWLHGIVSGLALGVYTATWGGSQMVWLLYPMILGFMLLINEDIKELVAAYTPTILVATFSAAALNPGNFWFSDTQFYLAAAFLGLLWLRYLVAEAGMIKESQTDYFIPSVYGFGIIALVLSPLYSERLAQIMFSIWSSATQTGGSTITGTVAENAPPGMASLTTQLGSGILDGMFTGAGLVSAVFSPWTLAFLALPIIGSSIYLMLGRKLDLLSDNISGRGYYTVISAVITGWVIGFGIFLEGHRALGIIVGLIISIALSLTIKLMDHESAFNISLMSLVFSALFVTLMSFRADTAQEALGVMRGLAYPAWIAVAGFGIIYSLDAFEKKSIELEWYKIFALFWLGSNILATTARSRLIYLASFAVALGAGYSFSVAFRKIKRMDLSEVGLPESNLRYTALGFMLVGMVTVNFVAGWGAVQGIQGSPNEAWMENLDYLKEETDDGSVVMSWWDYGYHFQSLGRSASVADGGNFRYYFEEGDHINHVLAEYFASDDPEENFEHLFDRHSVDYVVLDNTMIGKYSAVSQIALGDNENFNMMFQASTRGSFQDSMSQAGNRSVVSFTGQVDRFLAEVHVPIDEETAEINDAATMQLHTGERREITCVLTDEGIQEYGDGESEYCIAQDPYPGFERAMLFDTSAEVVIVPRDIAEHNLMKLYLMDGHGIDYLEKVDEASNDFIKAWEVQ